MGVAAEQTVFPCKYGNNIPLCETGVIPEEPVAFSVVIFSPVLFSTNDAFADRQWVQLAMRQHHFIWAVFSAVVLVGTCVVLTPAQSLTSSERLPSSLQRFAPNNSETKKSCRGECATFHCKGESIQAPVDSILRLVWQALCSCIGRGGLRCGSATTSSLCLLRSLSCWMEFHR